MAQQEQQKLVIVLQSNTAADPNDQWAKQVASLVNGRQNSIVVTSKISHPPASNLSIIYEDGDGSAPYGPVAWFDPALDHQGTKMSIDLTFYREKRISMPQEYYLCYFISIIVFEFVFSMARNGKKLRVLKPHEFDQVNDLVWRGALPESSKNTLVNLTNSLSQGLYRGFLEASTQILLIGQAVTHQLSEDARVVSDFLSGLSMSGIGDIYPQVRRKLIQWGPQASSRLEGSFSSADPKAMPLFIDFLEATPDEDSLYLLRAIASAEKIEDEPKSNAQMAYERFVKGKPRPTADPVRDVGLTVTPEPASAVGSTAGPDSVSRLAQTVDFAEKQGGPATEEVALEHPGVTVIPEPARAVGRTIPPMVSTGQTEPIQSDANVAKAGEGPAYPGRVAARNDGTGGPDLLGYDDYAVAIADIITADGTQTPLTIAVGGPWGRGKTKLLELIRDRVKGFSGRKTRCKCRIVEVTAWELSKTRLIWAELYTRILKQALSSNLLRRLMFRLRFAALKAPWKFWSTVAFVFLVVFVIADLFMPSSVPKFGLRLLEWKAVPEWVAPVIGAGSAILAVLQQIGGPLGKFILKGLNKRPLSPAPGSEQDILCSMEHVPQALQFAIGSRIVVLVDDLDRCSPKQVLSVIEAIRLFLNAKEFVFVLAMDCGVVTQAIGEHYKFMCQHPWERREMGREYLDKIIQVPFHLPPLTGEETATLARELLEPYSRKRVPTSEPPPGTVTPPPSPLPPGLPPIQPVEERLQQTRPDIPELHSDESEAVELFCREAGAAMSPRLIKRYVNVYMIARNIYISGRKEHPPASFAYWIGISVLYPAEATRCLTFFDATTDDPLVSEMAGYRFHMKVEDWHELNPARVEAFKRLYAALVIQHTVVYVNRTITDCFNLALD